MSGQYHLEIPVLSDLGALRELGQRLKVVAVDRTGGVTSRLVNVDERGNGAAIFDFAEDPGTVTIAFGPEGIDDAELVNMQTLTMRARVTPTLRLPPVKIAATFWKRWLRWCRKFVITGRVIDEAGNPVPGAEVTALDVDIWWWWSSKQRLGSATTGIDGAFQIEFTWCCGLLPRVWYKRRRWQLDTTLHRSIATALEAARIVREVPPPSPNADLSAFRWLVSDQEPSLLLRGGEVDPARLEDLRQKIRPILPRVPEIEPLRLWPWYAWQPWFDCSPDVIFRVRQRCDGTEETIVDETVLDARWNISTSIDVTLRAGTNACAVDQTDEPQGDCVLVDSACSIPLSDVGGNSGTAAQPVGYANPGSSDQPFGGDIYLNGNFGDATDTDFYEPEISVDGGVTYEPLMPDELASFARRVHWASGPGSVFQSAPVLFAPAYLPHEGGGERFVYETRKHYQKTHDPATWNISRFWGTGNVNLLALWKTRRRASDSSTSPMRSDGTYRLRFKGYRLEGGVLKDDHDLPTCATESRNGIVLTIDNRVASPIAGSIHLRTDEPIADILGVKIVDVSGAETAVGVCGVVGNIEGKQLVIEFRAYDADGHLDHYKLRLSYGDSLVRDLLALKDATVEPASIASGEITGFSPGGSSYATAKKQGATSPVWTGGTFKYRVDAALAFPEECAYLLELQVVKRTLVGCSSELADRNVAQQSFTVIRDH
ncbi:carboxypeptidase-like regulatory domain-containing protein [Sorangium sp. So ce1153]|uniref:carboxypeptidase-like regulatory domain-containing protein n=1 Tax=Sorangium sp. So ce1153 TaxID=3133333 RepID=UPI003F5F04B0